MTDCVLSIDFGTTRIKAGLCDDKGRFLAKVSAPAPAPTSWEGFDSFPAEAYWSAVQAVLRELSPSWTGPKPAARLVALCTASQRASVLGVGRDGKPVTPVLAWYDTSAAPLCEAFAALVEPARFREITGLPPTHVLSLFKILRLVRDVPTVTDSVHRYVLLPGYLLRCMGCPDYVCDPSHAGATGAYDWRQRGWSAELLAAAGLTPDQLSRLVPSGSVCGTVSDSVAADTGLPAGLPLVAGAGDQQCSSLAATGGVSGRIALCLGTAGFISSALDQPPTDEDSPFYCLPHCVDDKLVLEGVVNAVGSCLEWMARVVAGGDLAVLDSLADQSVPGARGLRFMPFIDGIGTPDYEASVRGAFEEIRHDHSREDMVRAVLEGVACELNRVIDEAVALVPAHELVVSGNVCRSPVLIDTLASLSELPIRVSRETDTSLLGAAAIGWAGAGRFSSIEEAALATGVVHLEPPRRRDAVTVPNLSANYGERVRQRISARRSLECLDTPADTFGLPSSSRHDVNDMVHKSLALAEVAFYCYKLDGTITFFDRASLRIIDLENQYADPSMLIGLNMHDLIEYIEPEGSLRHRIEVDGDARGQEYHFRTLTGKDRWMLHDSFLDADTRTGEPIVHAMVRDITKRKQSQLELEASRQRLRELARKLSHVREEERAQLARDIHDDIGQFLCGIHMQLQALAGRFPDETDAVEAVNAIGTSFGGLVERTRIIIRGLRPPALDELGLAAAMQQEVEAMRVRSNIDLHFTFESDAKVVPPFRFDTDLFRVLQEALNNAVRHSGGTRIDVRLTMTDERVELHVSDNGRGLPDDAFRRDGSYGLLGMQERVLAMEGTLEFGRNRSGGTRVTVTAPATRLPGSR